MCSHGHRHSHAAKMNSSYHNAASLALAVGIHSFKPGKNPMSSHHRLSSAFDELLHRWQGSLYKSRNRIFETREVRKGHRGMNVIGFRTPAPIWVLKNIKSRTRTICTAPLKGIACHKMQESCNKSWESKRHYRITFTQLGLFSCACRAQVSCITQVL